MVRLKDVGLLQRSGGGGGERNLSDLTRLLLLQSHIMRFPRAQACTETKRSSKQSNYTPALAPNLYLATSDIVIAGFLFLICQTFPFLQSWAAWNRSDRYNHGLSIQVLCQVTAGEATAGAGFRALVKGPNGRKLLQSHLAAESRLRGAQTEWGWQDRLRHADKYCLEKRMSFRVTLTQHALNPLNFQPLARDSWCVLALPSHLPACTLGQVHVIILCLLKRHG